MRERFLKWYYRHRNFIGDFFPLVGGWLGLRLMGEHTLGQFLLYLLWLAVFVLFPCSAMFALLDMAAEKLDES